jgi:hypothetical protein
LSELTGSLQEIAKQEAARRKALYDQALLLLGAIIDLIRSARQQQADVSLSLGPPTSRDSETCSGTLRCRSFHNGVGPDTRNYAIRVLPGRCQVELSGKPVELPEDLYDSWVREWEYENSEDFSDYDGPLPEVIVWGREYGGTDGYFTIQRLKQDIEEALITELAEYLSGIKALDI